MRFAGRTALLAALCATALLLGGCKSYSVTVQVEGQGSVTIDPDASSYASGTSVNLSATPATGWHLDHWGGDLNGNTNPATIMVDGNKAITAVFAGNAYTLTYTAATGGTISGGTSQTVNYGGNGTAVTAQPNAGYYFIQWSDAVLFSSRTDTNVIGDVTVTAEFARNVFRVDITHMGAENGLSWTKAFRDIQSGVDAASAAGGGEVWVADGVYTFQNSGAVGLTMAQHVDIYGGFAGNETARSERNVPAHDTVLEGGGHMCVWGASSATLDGFIITHGVSQEGGGMHNEGVEDLVVANCTFAANKAYDWMNYAYGAGMFNHNSSLAIWNCVFKANAIDGGGGAIGRGGGMCNNLSSPSVSNCIFINNLAYGEDGGGWIGRGGGMYNTNGSSPALTNCTFTLNSATGDSGQGGAIYNDGGSPTLKNCILWGDLAQNGPEIINTVSAAPTVTYSCIQGGYSGTGNISADPLFMGAASGYVQLKNGSPCIDTGASAGIRGTDIAGTPRPQGAGVDMGAYER